MKKVLVIMLMGVLVMVLGVTAGFAQVKTAPAVGAAIQKFDVNGDGTVTVAEYEAYWQGRFKDLDTNKDGKLIADEFAANEKRFFSEADANKDNVLVAQEFVAYYCGSDVKPGKPMKKGQKIDTNNDGKIDKVECVAYWTVRFNDMDKNKDKKVTVDEFMASINEQFKTIDKDKNGFITIQEYDVYWSPKSAPVK